jgi:hypothetical protein
MNGFMAAMLEICKMRKMIGMLRVFFAYAFAIPMVGV